MRKGLFLLLCLIAILFLSGCTGFKKSLFDWGLSWERGKSQFQSKTVQVNDLTISYLERDGGGETIVLLHGFGADKDNWLYFARYLPKKYRVIAIDQPGHGSNLRDSKTTYSIDFFTQSFANTIDALRLERFHLAGNSMGGYVGVLYTASHPEKVLTLCLIDPAGADSPQLSDREIALAHGVNPLVPRTREEFDTLMEYAFYQEPPIPWPGRSVMADLYAGRGTFNAKMWSDVMENRVEITNYLKKVTVPTLIQWGDRDRITHISALKVFQQGIPQAETVIFKDCGHMPMTEKPRESAEAYLSFLKNKYQGP